MAETLKAKEHDLGGFFVKRAVPQAKKRMVGPFIFVDQMGPGDFPRGNGINVRPHPHIGLSTLTYLFEGGILHRDSLGNHQEILPGDVNWMTAGKGIVHSERETFEVRATPHSLHGLQVWIALPEDKAEIEPSFSHIKKADLPHLIYEQVMIRLLAGEAYGLSSPLKTHSPMFYLDVIAGKGSKVERPSTSTGADPSTDQECALHIIYGSLRVGGKIYEEGDFVLLEDGDTAPIEATEDSRFVAFGGEKWDRIPLIEWNFVAFSKDRMEQAKADWAAGRFPKIPGDDKEYIPYG